VYRNGYQPSDDVSVGPFVMPIAATSGTRKAKTKSTEVLPPPPLGSLTKVNQVKRDRRTMEEVQAVSSVTTLLKIDSISGNEETEN
jgi:hypothetical protein